MVSQECKNLIKKMLVVDSQMRIKGIDAIKDPWFTKFRQVKMGS